MRVQIYASGSRPLSLEVSMMVYMTAAGSPALAAPMNVHLIRPMARGLVRASESLGDQPAIPALWHQLGYPITRSASIFNSAAGGPKGE